MSNLEVHFTNKSNEWETPRSLFKELDDWLTDYRRLMELEGRLEDE